MWEIHNFFDKYLYVIQIFAYLVMFLFGLGKGIVIGVLHNSRRVMIENMLLIFLKKLTRYGYTFYFVISWWMHISLLFNSLYWFKIFCMTSRDSYILPSKIICQSYVLSLTSYGTMVQPMRYLSWEVCSVLGLPMASI